MYNNYHNLIIFSYPIMITSIFILYEEIRFSNALNFAYSLYAWKNIIQIICIFGCNSLNFLLFWFNILLFPSITLFIQNYLSNWNQMKHFIYYFFGLNHLCKFQSIVSPRTYQQIMKQKNNHIIITTNDT